jgi:ferredoxin/flavodoxin
MKIEGVSCVCFSPTGSTKRIAEIIAQSIGPEKVNVIDVTKLSQRPEHPLTFHKEVVVLATPVYYGRVPEEAVSYFSTFAGEQTPAVVVVVYGNRAYDDALIELRDIATARNFIPIAGGAFLAEHSYSSPEHLIAPGRPDDSDLRKASEFGAAVRDKLLVASSMEDMTALDVPGNVPYIEPKNWNLIKNIRATTPLSFTPETDMNECTGCGLCAEICPTGAISPDDVARTDKLHCLICFACVKQCPEGARQMKIPQFEKAIQELSKACQDRREPEVYL